MTCKWDLNVTCQYTCITPLHCSGYETFRHTLSQWLYQTCIKLNSQQINSKWWISRSLKKKIDLISITLVLLYHTKS